MLIFIALIILVYTTIKYFLNPKRKLELAHEKRQFYFYDDTKNVRKNFQITYKGVLFAGEKKLGTTDQAFDVVQVIVWAKHSDQLKGLDRQDFAFIEQEIIMNYPHTNIEWKSPIKEFLRLEKN